MTKAEAITELVRIWHSPHLDLSLKAGLGEVIDALKADTVQGADLINKHDAITVIRDQCWKCNNVINDDLCMRILALPDSEQTDCTEFIEWLIEVIMDDDDWELNSAAYGEIIARKMKKLGLLEVKDGYYIRPSAESAQGWIPVSEKPKDEKRTYLVQLDSGGMRSCRWTNANPIWTELTTDWHWNIFDIPQYCKVVAWMDLEPYREDGEA